MHRALHDILNFVMVSVVLNFFIVPWIEAAVRKMVWKWLLRSERDVAVYLHHKLRMQTRKVIHAPKSPVPCDDGMCRKI